MADVAVSEVVNKTGERSFVELRLEDVGVVGFPDHVLVAAGDAALTVLEHFRRAGTACGHVAWRDTGRCAVMTCEQYAERWRTR